jgi:hypothetical protein
VFFRRVPTENPTPEDPDKVEYAYVDAELPSVGIGDLTAKSRDEAIRSAELHDGGGPIDYDIFPGPEGDWEGAKMGWWARLNVRAILFWGETEHAAVRRMMNGIARLCTAGSLDHTGRPVLGNPRRRAALAVST